MILTTFWGFIVIYFEKYFQAKGKKIWLLVSKTLQIDCQNILVVPYLAHLIHSGFWERYCQDNSGRLPIDSKPHLVFKVISSF